MCACVCVCTRVCGQGPHDFPHTYTERRAISIIIETHTNSDAASSPSTVSSLPPIADALTRASPRTRLLHHTIELDLQQAYLNPTTVHSRRHEELSIESIIRPNLTSTQPNIEITICDATDRRVTASIPLLCPVDVSDTGRIHLSALSATAQSVIPNIMCMQAHSTDLLNTQARITPFILL